MASLTSTVAQCVELMAATVYFLLITTYNRRTSTKLIRLGSGVQFIIVSPSIILSDGIEVEMNFMDRQWRGRTRILDNKIQYQVSHGGVSGNWVNNPSGALRSACAAVGLAMNPSVSGRLKFGIFSRPFQAIFCEYHRQALSDLGLYESFAHVNHVDHICVHAIEEAEELEAPVLELDIASLSFGDIGMEEIEELDLEFWIADDSFHP